MSTRCTVPSAAARLFSSCAREGRSQVWTMATLPTTIFTLFVCSAPRKCHSIPDGSPMASAFSRSSWA